uniref:uncharacterized protein isoform X3 n=1 Tax=Myxine glutinosa TaxID=7769 RepID=UPI00358F78CA
MATTLLPETPLHPLGQEFQPQLQHQPQLIHTLQQSQPRQKHHLRPRPQPQPQRQFMFQLPSQGQSEIAQPTHSFSVWLSQQGMTPRFGQAVARYLGIRDLADLRACAEEPAVRAEFLDAARRFLPFASYVALRRLVKTVTPPQQQPPFSPEKEHVYPNNSINTFEEGDNREALFKREEERGTQMKRNKRGGIDFEGHEQDCNGEGGRDQGWTQQPLACSLLQAIVEMLTSLGQELLHSATTFSRLQPTLDTEERAPTPQDFPPGEEIMEDGVIVNAREGPTDALAACAENEENHNWDNEDFIDGYMQDSKAAVCPEDENHESMIKTESDLDQETGFPDALVGWVPEMAGWTAAEGNGWDREGERLGHEITSAVTISEWTPNKTGLSEQGQSSTFVSPSTIPAARPLPSGSRPKQKSRPAFMTSLHTGPGGRPKPFACILCGERFTHASGLSRHKRIHAEKPYKCEMCGKEFLLAYTLIRHSRMHT